MLKRTNKVAALLVAATSVASLAPAGAMAADYKRISSEDGTVYSATAFKDGSYVIDGNVVDEDTDAVYYVKDGKYTELEDVDSGSTLSLYGDHYLSVDSGDYYIDLNTGKVTDDDIESDTTDDLELTLKRSFKNVDRYDLVNNLPTIDENNLLAGPKYGELWYSVGGVTLKDSNNDNNGNNASIYSDAEGNYIDADYNLGRIKVVTSATSANSATSVKVGDTKISTIENSEDDVDGIGSSEITARVVNDTTATPTVIGQDANYIYRVATIEITAKEGAVIKSIDGVDVKSNLVNEGTNTGIFTDVNGDQTVIQYPVIQKISKAQASGDIDGANYAKNVTNYIPCNKDNETADNSGNPNKARAFYNLINNNIVNGKLSDGTYVSIANGKVIVYQTFDKDNTVTSKNIESVNITSTNLKTKGALNYFDTENTTNDDVDVIDTDVNGNVYRLKDGYIYKFDNTDDWDKLYRVDGSMDEFSVYDSNNMIVWNESNEVYSLIGSSASNNDEDNNDDNTDNNTPAVTAGWNQAANGTWTYVNADGTTVKGWFQSPLSGKWFFMDPTTGVMQTGWVQSPYSGQWFYMNPSNGDMETGWVQSPASGKWYFMNLTNGNMETGWVQSPYSGKWYYMDASGAMVTNTTVNGYVLGADGAWIR